MSLRYTFSSVKLDAKGPKAAEGKNALTVIDYEWAVFGQWFAPRVGQILQQVKCSDINDVEEIRLRIGKPLLLHTSCREIYLGEHGYVTKVEAAYRVTKEDIAETMERMTRSSIYAAEEELKQGFICLPGGHRVGITGEAVLSKGEIQTLKYISGLNVRVAHEKKGKGLEVLPFLLDSERSFKHTLIISPPRAGKTTLLRDIIRLLSNGVPQINLKGQAVGVVDERGELAGMWQGEPTYDLGLRTDVLDGCPKAAGMRMLIRSMAPGIIAADELGHPEDINAMTDALRSGVSVLSTAHAASLEEAKSRPILRVLFAEGVFERLVVLSRRKGPGTVERIYDLKTNKELYTASVS